MKRLYSLLLCIAMIVSLCPVLADTGTVISVTGGWGWAETNRSGSVVTPVIEVVSGEEPAGYDYQWYYMKDGSGEWQLLPWETGSSLVVSTNESAGTVAVDITPLDADGNPIGATAEKVSSAHTWMLKEISAIPNFTKAVGTPYQNTPAEYLFEVDGVKLIMLDLLKEGNYYVMMESGAEKLAFDPDGTVIFDPSDENNIAYWLNNDFLSSDALPDEIKGYIVESSWNTEAPLGGSSDSAGAVYWNQYTKTAKVGLLSATEFYKYLGRFGLYLPNYQSKVWMAANGWEGWLGDSGFWLRTARGSGAHGYALASNQWGWDGAGDDIGGSVAGTDAKLTTRFARPTFRLSPDFFADNTIDLSKAGSKVKQALMSSVGLEGLLNLYTMEELLQYEVFKMPEASKLTLGGSFRAGDAVTGDYTYYSEEKAAEVGSVYGFAVSDTSDGEYVSIAEGVKECTIPADAEGKYLTFYVTPCDERGLEGDLYRSEPVRISSAADVIVTNCDLSIETAPVVTLENLSAEEVTVLVMAGVYDTDNRLVSNCVAPVTVPAGETASSAGLSLTVSADDTVKVMVWRSLGSMECIYLSDK